MATAVARVVRPPLARRIGNSRILPRIMFVVAFLLVWQAITPFLPTRLVPAPLEVFGFMWDELRADTLSRTTIYEAFWISLQRLLIGFLAALVVGIPVGLLMGMARWAEDMLRDWIVVTLTIPYLVWALLMGMWLGLSGLGPTIVVFLAGISYVVYNVYEGVKNSPKDLYDMARAYDVPRSRIVRSVLFPSLMPFLFAAFRYGVANGWKALVVAEVFASTTGAGWNIRYWYDAHRAQGVIGYALFFILFAIFVERAIFEPLSNRVFRWRPSEQAQHRLVEEEFIPESQPKGAG